MTMVLSIDVCVKSEVAILWPAPRMLHWRSCQPGEAYASGSQSQVRHAGQRHLRV